MALWACSDLHGHYDLCKQILDYIGKNDTLYFLGDAIDRGPQSYLTMTKLLDDPRVVYLLGNHEDLFLKSVYNILYYEQNGKDIQEAAPLWWKNNGRETWNQMKKNLTDVGIIDNLVCHVTTLPKRVDVTNANNQHIILTHAGTSPHMTELGWLSLGVKDPYLWNRYHFSDPWIKGFDNVYIVHGHTPSCYIWGNPTIEQEEEYLKNPQVAIYAGGHKYDLDLATHWSKTAALMNLDTFEIKYFKES